MLVSCPAEKLTASGKLEGSGGYHSLIVGAGLSGAVVARELAEQGKKVLVVDKREHIGGNCFDYVDKASGFRVAEYGAWSGVMSGRGRCCAVAEVSSAAYPPFLTFCPSIFLV